MSETPELPPLPGPAYGWFSDYYDGWSYTENPTDRWQDMLLFTEEQVSAYGRECWEAGRRAGLEEAVKLGLPPKLWLWRNGPMEFWAFDNAYPVHLDCGDPQTLGEPCGYAIFKPSRVGRTDKTEEQVLEAVARSNAPLPTHQRLMKFYGVTSLEALVDKQAYHIERLQEKLPPAPSLAPQRVREG